MKTIFSSLLIALIGISAGGQQLVKQNYLKKSKDQKTMAWILATGGGALVVGGVISYAAESNTSFYPGETVGTILMTGGAVAIAGGIVLFSASKRNERKAHEATVAFKLKVESSELYRVKFGLEKYYPAISLKLDFR